MATLLASCGRSDFERFRLIDYTDDGSGGRSFEAGGRGSGGKGFPIGPTTNTSGGKVGSGGEISNNDVDASRGGSHHGQDIDASRDSRDAGADGPADAISEGRIDGRTDSKADAGTREASVDANADGPREASAEASSSPDPLCVDGDCAPDRVCNTATNRCEPACDVADQIDPLSPWAMFAGCPTNRGVSRYVGPSRATVLRRIDLGGGESGLGYRSPTIGRDGTLYVPGVSLRANLAFELTAFRPDGTVRFVGPRGALPPSISTDGTLWVGSTNGLYHLDADGNEIGALPNEILFTVSPHFLPGGDFVAGNASIERFDTNLNLIWTVNPSANFSMNADLAIGADGTTYACAAGASGFVALRPDGSERWRRSIGDGSCNTPTVGHDGTVYVGNNSGITAVTANNDLLWFVDFGLSSPRIQWITIAPDGTLIVHGTGEQPGMYGLSPAGDVLWKHNEADQLNFARPVVDRRGTVFSGLGGTVVAVEAKTGKAHWVHQESAYCGSPAIAADGTLYVDCGTELVALGE
jgi:outer membrane protein assembly factor BamB